MPKLPPALARFFPLPRAVRAVLVLLLIYIFLVGVSSLEGGIKVMGKETQESLFSNVDHPLAGLFVGILGTVLVQSSSASTSVIVGLVASGALGVDAAVPMIMGANIGTTVTNTIVSLGSARQTEGFRLAFTAATMHDFFNLIAVAILLPLEIATGFLLNTATWIAEKLPVGQDATFDSPIKGAVKWGASQFERILELFISNETVTGVSMIVLGIAIIFITLTYITRNMRILIASRIETSMNAALARSGLVGMGVGVIVTIAVQSSSITTSILVPLVAAGILAVRNAYPITLGANIGTTITAFLAALATGTLAGMEIALVHLLFNVFAILIIYPFPRIRYIPVDLAGRLAKLAMNRKTLAIGYVVVAFIVVPVLGIVIFN